MKRLFFSVLFCFFLLIGSANAQIINGDFETGDFTGWTQNNAGFVNLGGLWGSYTASVPAYQTYVSSTLYQEYDNSLYSSITFNFTRFSWGRGHSIAIYDDANLIIQYGPASATLPTSGTRTINLSAYTGTGKILISGSALYHPSFPDGEYVRIDNVVLTPMLPQITTIQTRITKETFPLTGIVINDVNSTGGFSNEYGYVTLTPTNNSEKIYPISLTGNDLINGFELQITATGSEVTATPITVNDLGADRTYNIYLDGQFLEAIGEITSYQYNITSFSTHTLKVEYDYYVPPGDEEGGGSGQVTPPDEDIPPDEDEIIIEDDVITIGELTITKEEFQLLTVEQIEAMNVSQETKDKLIAIKSINVNWWLFILVISLTGLIVEGSYKKGHESIIIISFVGVVISAYKLGYF